MGKQSWERKSIIRLRNYPEKHLESVKDNWTNKLPQFHCLTKYLH